MLTWLSLSEGYILAYILGALTGLIGGIVLAVRRRDENYND